MSRFNLIRLFILIEITLIAPIGCTKNNKPEKQTNSNDVSNSDPLLRKEFYEEEIMGVFMPCRQYPSRRIGKCYMSLLSKEKNRFQPMPDFMIGFSLKIEGYDFPAEGIIDRIRYEAAVFERPDTVDASQYVILSLLEILSTRKLDFNVFHNIELEISKNDNEFGLFSVNSSDQITLFDKEVRCDPEQQCDQLAQLVDKKILEDETSCSIDMSLEYNYLEEFYLVQIEITEGCEDIKTALND